MTRTTRSPRQLVIGLSVAQLIGWGSVFYGFALFMEPVGCGPGLDRASSLAFSPGGAGEWLAAARTGPAGAAVAA